MSTNKFDLSKETVKKDRISTKYKVAGIKKVKSSLPCCQLKVIQRNSAEKRIHFFTIAISTQRNIEITTLHLTAS